MEKNCFSRDAVVCGPHKKEMEKSMIFLSNDETE